MNEISFQSFCIYRSENVKKKQKCNSESEQNFIHHVHVYKDFICTHVFHKRHSQIQQSANRKLKIRYLMV